MIVRNRHELGIAGWAYTKLFARRSLPSVSLTRLMFVGCIGALLQTATVAASHASDEFDTVLSDWIGNQLYFFSDSAGRSKLFIRREPVRVAFHSEVPEVENNVRLAIRLLSLAAGVELEFTTKNPNLIAFVSSPIADGDKPNRDFLKRIGLPSNAIDIVKDQTGWSSGCGIYSFGQAEGKVSLSLVLAEKRLAHSNVVDCMTDGVIRAFGLRTASRTVLRYQDGYYQYLLLAAALRSCDVSLGKHDGVADREELKKKYVDCSVEYFKQRKSF